ncbi:MAG: glycosyltransferase family 4 protein [Pseudomonadota bacterium]|nr:glycosyltransferase family 4 protein [Pseudomonadota bacterium]
MRLLILEPDPRHGGGSEAVMLSLGRELAGRGHEINLLHETSGSMLAHYQAFCRTVVRKPLPGFAMRQPHRTLGCVRTISRLARELDVDAVLSSHLGFLRHAALVRRVYGVPFCFHLGLPLEGRQLSIRLALGSAGAGVAPSAHTLESWHRGGWPADALHEVRNWVDPARFRPSADVAGLRRELGMPVDQACVVFVGRVCAQKGVDVLIEAFAALATTREDTSLLLVGPVASDYALHLQARLDALDGSVRARIHLMPATATPERFHAAADLVCAPSLGDETFGLAVVEAMASGVPVIASALGVVGEILGDGNEDLLVPAGDAAALRASIESWLADPVRLRMRGRQLRDRAVAQFGPGPSVLAYEQILADLRGCGRAGRN